MVQEEDENPKADLKSTSKICLLPHQPLASLLRRLSAAGMSTGSIRPLFTLLLLAVLAATFTSRFSLSGAGIHLSTNTGDRLPLPAFNSTLIKLAESDPAGLRLQQEIDLLLEGNFTKLAGFRPFVIWRRFTAAVDLHGRSFSNIPINISSPAFYRLYLQFNSLLSDWSRHRNNQQDLPPENSKTVLSDLLRLLNRRKKYSSCAVVGNSGILLNSNHGSSIDSHAAVFRLNNARIEGFSRNVGGKTTISFVNSNILHLCGRRKSCPCYPYGSTVPLLLYICQPIHFLDFATCNSTSSSLNRAPILVTDPRFDLLCTRIVKYYSLKRWFEDLNRNRSLEGWSSAHDGMLFHYSSGMQAVVTAAAVCERVSLFGFGKANTAKHHYHTNQKAELSLHDYEAEYEFYRDLVERPNLIPFLSNSGFRLPPVQIYQ